MLKRLIVSVLIILCAGCTTYVRNNNYKNMIYIESIGIKEEVNISSMEEDVNGVAMFSEYGRPDQNNSNTVIGAHSGYGPNAIFNELKSIKDKSVITLIYNNNKYDYIVERLYEVGDNDIDILNNKKYGMLTLITCKMEDLSKRIVVVARLISNI